MALLKLAPGELDLECESDREAEADRQRATRDELVMACRAVARELGYDACAAALDLVWGPLGRSVSASSLRAALNDAERNYFRFEWVLWFATQSESVRDVLRAIADGRSKKSEADELRDLQELVRRKLPEDAEGLIRKAKTTRTRR